MAAVLVLGTILIGAAASDKVENLSKPNVVLIVADDYGKVDFTFRLLLKSY